VIRYPKDNYMVSSEHGDANPWYVCTLWLGRHYANLGNIDKAYEALDWTLDHVNDSGMLSEQIDPDCGDIRGVTPLVWSHAEYLSLLIKLNHND
jgi:GH15 family glucan-1,4-alpha-glucosidase